MYAGNSVNADSHNGAFKDWSYSTNLASSAL